MKKKARRRRPAVDSWFLKLGLVVGSLVFTFCFFLGITELLIRSGLSPWEAEKYTVTIREAQVFDRAIGTGFVDHHFLPFGLKPGVYPIGEGKKITINSRGYRGPEFAVPKPPGTFRVLLVGDSYIYGFGLDDADIAAARLEKKLRALHPGAEVINAGFHGSSPMQYELFLRREGYELDPDLVVVALLPDNDYTDVVVNIVEERNPAGEPMVIRDGLVAFKGRRYYEDLTPWLVRLPVLRHSMAWFHFLKLVHKASVMPGDQRPSRETMDVFMHEPIQALESEAKKRNRDLRFLILPGGEVLAGLEAATFHYAHLRKALETRGIRYWDIGPELRRHPAEKLRLYFRNELGNYSDPHYNADASEMLASYLALKILPLLPKPI